MVLGKLWKVYRGGLENWLIGLLQPVIDNLKKPSYVERVEIKQFSLGEEPLSVRNVERRTSRRANDLQYQIGLRYTGGARMLLMLTLKFGFIPVKVPVGIRDFDIDGELWVKLRLIPTEPWVGAVSWAFVSLPKINFRLSPFRLFNVMAIPVLSMKREAILETYMPEEPGSFKQFCEPGETGANVLVGIQVPSSEMHEYRIEYHQVQHRFEQPNHIGHRCVNEAAKHIELGPHGTANTHPVATISGAGDLASGDTSNVAPEVSIPICNVAPDTSIRFGNFTSTEHGEELHRLPTPTEALGNISGPTALTGLLLYSGAIISMLLLGYLGVLVLAGGSLVIGFANITGYSRAMISMLFILRPCATEAAKHIELGPHGAADTHPVAPIDDVTGDLESGGIDTGAPDSSIPIANVAPDTSIPIDIPSDSDGDSTSGGIGTSDPSDPNGDSNSGGIGNRPGRGPSRDFTKGILFLFMAMIAEFGPNLMQVAGSTHKHNLKLLLWGINMSAAGCFLSCCCGLLGEVMGMVDCRLFSRSSLQVVQKISLVAASTFMMAAMIMVFIFTSEAMV